MKAAIKHVLFACMMMIVSTRLLSAVSTEEFILKVTLDPGGKSTIETIVVPQRAFDASKVVNGERITIKGDLAAKRGDHYHLRLTLSEWRSEKTNNRQSCEIDLTPGKVEYFGFISSIVYMRTILLTPISKEKRGQ